MILKYKENQEFFKVKYQKIEKKYPKDVDYLIFDLWVFYMPDYLSVDMNQIIGILLNNNHLLSELINKKIKIKISLKNFNRIIYLICNIVV